MLALFFVSARICSMIEQHPKEEVLGIIKEIESQPAITQRGISVKLGISLGKTNYLLKELIKKGIIEVRNFSELPGKMTKIHYLLTRKGLEHKIFLLQHFLKEKEEEFNRLKSELDKVSDRF